MNVTLLYFEGCPNWQQAAALIRRLSAEQPDVVIEQRIVDTDENAHRVGFIGSPTILIDGTDPWASAGAPAGLSCRMYATPEGLRGCPTWEMLLAAVEPG